MCARVKIPDVTCSLEFPKKIYWEGYEIPKEPSPQLYLYGTISNDETFLRIVALQVNYVQDKWNRTMEESAWCGIPFDKPDISSQLLMVISSCIFFVAPMTLILILYLRIALVLHRSSRNRSLRRCCASHHSPNMASTASVAYANNQVQGTGNVILTTNNTNNTMPTPPNIGSSGKRCQAERAHIQSRRAVIRMLGNSFIRLT